MILKAKSLAKLLLILMLLPITTFSASAATEYTYKSDSGKVYRTTDGTENVVENADMIFVDATNGDDSNDGSYAMPLKSVACAVERSESCTRDTYIVLKPGKYNVEDTINITPKHTNNKKLVIMSYGDGAVITGEKVLSGDVSIHDSANNIYVMQTDKGLTFRQLYVDGVRKTRATSAIPTDLTLTEDKTAYVTTSEVFGKISHPENVEFVYEISWMNPRCAVESVTTDGDGYKIKMNSTIWEKGNSFMRGNYPLTYVSAPVSMENAYEFIDTAGEWYYDSESGKLFYKADTGETVSSETFTVSQTQTLLNIVGSANVPCKNVEIHNISFENTKWEYVTESGGFLDTQASCIYMNGAWYKYLPSAVNIESADTVKIHNCTFTKLGANAVRVIGASKNVTVTDNTVYDVSGSGIVAGNVRSYQNYFVSPYSDKYSTEKIVISNNKIHDIGVEYGGSVAIQTGYADTVEISHNEIHDIPYSAIHVGWGWQANETSAIKNTVISDNKIYNFMTNFNDGAAIYTLGSTGGTNDNMNVISGNYIKAGSNGTDNYMNGIYLDQGSNYWAVHDNVVEKQTENSKYYWLLVNTPKYSKIYDNYTNFEGYNLPYQSYEEFAVDFTQATVTSGSWGESATQIINNAGIKD